MELFIGRNKIVVNKSDGEVSIDITTEDATITVNNNVVWEKYEIKDYKSVNKRWSNL